MKIKSPKYLLLFFLSGLLFPVLGQSILGSGQWHKIPITQNGVYKIDAAFLDDNDIDTKELKPQNVRFFISPEKLLPQENAIYRDTDLKEIPVYLKGASSSFSDNFILFYAENSDIEYLDSYGKLRHKQHPYANENYVFMEVGTILSKRITAYPENVQNAKQITSLRHFEWYEPQFINLLNTGREWLGEYLVSEWDKKIEIKGRITERPISLRTQWISQTFEDTELSIFTPETAVGKIPMKLINYRWNDSYKRYNRAGEISQGDFLFSEPNESFELTFQLPNDIDISSGAYLDFIEIEADRKIDFYASQHQGYVLDSEAVSFAIAQNQNEFIWDISNLTEPKELTSTTFKKTSDLGKLAFFSLDNVFSPENIEAIPSQNLQSQNTPNLLIIYPEYFKNEVSTLTKFRKEHDKLDVLTVTLQSIYNEFSGGKADPTAIRDFIKSLWDKNPEKFKYLLLFGDTNFDIKNNNNLSYVKTERLIPTYESKESLEPIYSYSSDDYFGFLETHEGEWPEGFSRNRRWYSSSNKDHSLDISVGRLPVKNKIEAKLLVDKLIHYSTSKKNFGSWKRNISFVADDGDLNIHQRDAERFSSLVLEKNTAIKSQKIYLDAYPQLETEFGEQSPEANRAFEKAMKEGSLIINFNGHGSENGWTDEKLLTIAQIQRWRNIDRLPILFTATCEFGRYDNPAVVSGAELALLNPNGGAIALLTTTRPVFSSTNFKINSAFYNRIFEKTSSPIRLGDVFKVTKNNSIDGEVNRNFSLLGDPSMAISYPNLAIELESINKTAPKDFQIKGLQKITLTGTVNDASFNGKISVSLYDKPVQKNTLAAAGNTKMTFKSLDNKVFEGMSEVVNGTFESTFIVPKDLAPEINYGQLYFYAVNSDSTKDAIGGYNQFLIGGQAEEINTDIIPPIVQMSFNEDNLTLTILIEDESGVNISSVQSDENLVLVLNDTLHIPLIEYYAAIKGYQNGQIIYVFSKLPPGQHTVRLKIADVYNNQSEAAFSFTIEVPVFELSKTLFYPNPSADIVSLKLKHNAAGEDIRFNISFYNVAGKLMGREIKDCYSCENELSFGMNIEPFFPVQDKYFYQVRAYLIDNKQKATKGGQLMFWK